MCKILDKISFGYWAFQSGVDLPIIQQILNHGSPGTTLAYIGMRREERDAVYLGLNKMPAHSPS